MKQFAWAALAVAARAATNSSESSQHCGCGYKDDTTGLLFTESLVAYFNETNTLEDFEILDYHNRKEKGWNTIYRQGSNSSNVAFGNNGSLIWQDWIDGNASSLELYIDPSDHHYVQGIELRSKRQDMLYGTFRASLRSAQPGMGGSALTMMLEYNSSNSLELDMLNMQDPNRARVMQTINGEWPSQDLAINYTVLETQSNQSSASRPWDFVDIRLDWSDEHVDFWIGDNRTRAVSKDKRPLPSVPQPLHLRHWSTGDTNFMQGPPLNRSVANVRWIRSFFNTSLMTEADHVAYNERCIHIEPCSVDDMRLRGSSLYPEAATIRWQPKRIPDHIKTVAGIVAAACSTLGVASLINAFFRRMPWRRLKELGVAAPTEKAPKTVERALRNSIAQIMPQMVGLRPPDHEGERWLLTNSGPSTPLPVYSPGERSPTFRSSSPGSPGASTPAPSYHSAGPSWSSINFTLSLPSARASHSRSNSDKSQDDIELDPLSVVPCGDEAPSSSSSSSYSQSNEISDKAVNYGKHGNWSSGLSDGALSNAPSSNESSHASPGSKELPNMSVPEIRFRRATSIKPDAADAAAAAASKPEVKKIVHTETRGAAAVPPVAAPKQRIDHLAGLVALSCLGVTVRHFSLTFWPYVTQASGDVKHFAADSWLAYILGPYILSPLLIGPFFVTSCRFLVARYLKNGKLDDIANKMLLRGARMLIPCFIFMTLEYFLLSLGLTGTLEYLPSISYSVWPYVVPQPNFGVFLNEMVELAYLIPNAAPEVINHYCVGVLWTIPVQHYFSYVTLMAAVIIKDIKKPWKRTAIYTLAIVAGWYATSWSACHWAGLLLADLDITYNWIKWAQARWYRLYPILATATIMAGLAPLALLFNFEFTFMAYENGIHPDPITGRPIIDTVSKADLPYPDFYAPSLAVLVFSVALQIVVELSTSMQWVLSLKCITVLHPHIMTIYLTHGFVFWSLGAWLAVTLGTMNVPYWALLLIVALVCYTVIFAFAFMVSPLVDFATMGATRNIWRMATEKPVPHRSTTAPFDKSLVLGRQGAESAEA